MERSVLTDAQWALIEPHCRDKPSDPGRKGRNNRLFMEAVLWIACTRCPWRDLPTPSSMSASRKLAVAPLRPRCRRKQEVRLAQRKQTGGSRLLTGHAAVIPYLREADIIALYQAASPVTETR
ncbi:transposase [Acetobacter senegalensis]|uniref:transposase n=1 Tax=Acetobacter senegalensis TaxID=446692 RepID=UPI0038B3A3F9